MNISAIILAAGKGKRIGKPKWQLAYEGRTFLEIVVAKLLSCGFSDIVCVARDAAIVSILSSGEVKVVINATPEMGMISSLYYGIQSMADNDGYLVFPVDHPFVDEATIIKLCDAFLQQPNAVVCPVYRGNSGHPIIVPNRLAQKITPQYFELGLRQFLREQDCSVIKVDVDDEGVLRNINFGKDLEDKVKAYE